jgi:hypothetical protein
VERLLDLAGTLPDVRIEHASGSFMVKAPATFLAIRPRGKDVQVTFMLDHEVSDFPISKSLRTSAHRVAHAVHVSDPQEVDDQLTAWIREAHAICRRRHRP